MRRAVRSTLISPLGLPDRYIGFDSQPQDADAECARVASWLEQNGPIDTCVLGLGHERPHRLQRAGRISRAARRMSQAFAGVARHCHASPNNAAANVRVDVGNGGPDAIAPVLLLVTGSAKREAARRLLSGPITTDFPASLLQLHPKAAVLCDAAADVALNLCGFILAPQRMATRSRYEGATQSNSHERSSTRLGNRRSAPAAAAIRAKFCRQMR